MHSRRPGAQTGAATIRDVARLAAVSIKTVSRVINGERYVRKETAARVRKAAAELDYKPNLLARGLVTDRSYQIALWHGLLESGISSYYTKFQNNFVSSCRRMHYGAMLEPLDPDSPRLLEEAIALIRQQRPCCIVMTPPFSDNEELLSKLDDEGIRYVRVSPSKEDPERPFVATDDREAARIMTEYLIDRGHRRLGFVSGHADHGAAARRTEGFLAALSDRGIQPDERLMVPGTFKFESGVEAARRLLTNAEPPTAIFASNDDMAAGVIHFAHEFGLSMPGDLSVAGFDDTAIARYIYPTLTTVAQPIREMTETAIRYLIGRAERADTGAGRLAERLPCSLVIRDSVGPPPPGRDESRPALVCSAD